MPGPEERFSTDNCTFFVGFFNVDEVDFSALINWIQAPNNLQQFAAVIKNLSELLAIDLHPTLAAELDLDIDLMKRWHILSLKLKNLLTYIPVELSDIRPNKQVRPAGLIGSYPIYASLTAAQVDYSVTEFEKCRAIHLIGMSCATAYQKMHKEGVIKEKSTGFESGLREIRELERSDKRPAIPLPDWSAATSLTDIQAELEDWIEQYTNETKWGRGLLLLITSVAEQRSRASRHYRMRMSTRTKRSGQQISLQESIDADGVNQPIPRIEPVLRVADDRSAKLLQQQGLHHDEMSTLAAVLVKDPAAPSNVQIDNGLMRQRNRRRIQAAVVKSAQSLPTDNSMPTPYDMQTILHCLDNDFFSQYLPDLDAIQRSELKVIILLRLYTGRTLESLRKLLVFEDVAAYKAARRLFFAVLIKQRCLTFPVKSTATPQSLGKIGNALLDAEPFYHRDIRLQNVFALKLPSSTTKAVVDLAVSKLQSVENTKRIRLFEHAEHHQQWIRQLLKDINKTYHTRWTEHRLGLVMRLAVEQCTQDPAMIQLITEQETGHSVVASYYQRTSIDYIAEIVHTAQQWIQSWVRTGTLTQPEFNDSLRNLEGSKSIGSNLALPTNFVAELCAHLKHHAKMGRRGFIGLERLRQSHNSLVAYITVWLGFISGYRAVLDPISDPRHLDRETGLMIISDKDNALFQHARIIPLTKRFVKQMDHYVEHLTQLAIQLPHKPSIQEDIYQLCNRYHRLDNSENELSIPFLFFLTDSLQARAVSPKHLAAHYPFELKANANRHYLRSSLIELGAPSELISYFMGHWKHGEEPHQKLSSVSPVDIAVGLMPYLATLEKQVGWTVQGGLAHV